MRKIFENKKVLLGITSLIVCLGVIVVTSFWPFILDPSHLKDSFLADEIIICSITIFSMISALFIGQASNAKNPESKIAKAIVKFKETILLIKDRNAFAQWIKKVLQPNDIQSIKIRKLRKLGIENNDYLDFSIPEIKALLDTPQKYNGKFYHSLTKEQVKGLIKIKESKENIAFVEPGYYLTYQALDSEKTVSERSGNETKKKASAISLDLVGKIVLTLCTALVFGSLVYDAQSGISGPQMWLNFASRLWALLSSAFLGYTTGCKINDIDASYIWMRIDVHILYSQDKTFVALSEEELAKEEFKARVLKEEHKLLEGKSNQIEMKQEKIEETEEQQQE